MQVFKNSNLIIAFGLRAYILSMGKLLSVIFCDLTSLLSFYQPHHNQSSTITGSQLLNNYYLLVVLSSKNSVHEREKVASSAHNSIIQKLFLETTFILQSAAEVLYGCIYAHKYFWITGIIYTMAHWFCLFALPAPQECQGANGSFGVLLKAFFSFLTCFKGLFWAVPPLSHGWECDQLKSPREQELVSLIVFPISFPSVDNLMSLRFLFTLVSIFKTETQARVCVCVCVCLCFFLSWT